LDGDTASTPAKIAALMSDFASGATEILIGTQMISRSVEGCRVSVACILNVDSLMNLPDFRTHERAYQTVRRLIGLVGYSDLPGSVLIQTSQPSHPLVLAMSRGDYASMSRAQLTERYQFRYPPYTRLITLVLSSTDESGLLSYADSYVASLQDLLGTQVYGPVVMPLRRKQHTVQIILKLEPDAGVVSVRDQLREVEERLYTSSVSKRIKLYYDVDN
jgi:primosomal protein N' (replication factor Y)